MITELLLSFKSSAFHEEREWRLILVQPLALGAGLDPDDDEPAPVRFRTDGRHIIPYYEYDGFGPAPKGSKLPLKGVITGPGIELARARHGLRALMGDYDQDAPIDHSRIPLRG